VVEDGQDLAADLLRLSHQPAVCEPHHLDADSGQQRVTP